MADACAIHAPVGPKRPAAPSHGSRRSEREGCFILAGQTMGASACDTLAGDASQQPLHRSVTGNFERWCDVGERAQHECARVHAWMGNRQIANAHATAAE